MRKVGYKLPELSINYTSNDRTQSFRFIPGIAASGFYISPIVKNSNQLFDQLVFPCRSNSCPNDFSIDAGVHADLFYTRIEVELYAHNVAEIIRFGSGAERSIQKLELLQAIASTSDRGPRYVSVEGDMLHAHAPSLLEIEKRSGKSIAKIKYGIRAGAADKMRGVCFSIKGEQGQSFAHDCIERKVDSSKAVEKTFYIDQGDYRGNLYLENTCIDNNCAYAWSYWSDLSLHDDKGE